MSVHADVQDFYRNFANDPKVKIPWVRRDLCGPRVLTMEWIDGIRCTDPVAIRASGMDVSEFIRCGVVTGLRQLLEVRTHGMILQCVRMYRGGAAIGFRRLLVVCRHGIGLLGVGTIAC